SLSAKSENTCSNPLHLISFESTSVPSKSNTNAFAEDNAAIVIACETARISVLKSGCQQVMQMNHSHDFSALAVQHRQNGNGFFPLPHDFQSFDGHLIMKNDNGRCIHDFRYLHHCDALLRCERLTD